MEIYTIGFTRTTAERFFARLREAGVERVLDVRLRNSSQLAGFAKAQDLPFLLRELVGARYEHDLRLSPTAELMAYIKKEGGAWPEYERRFLELLARRGIERVLSRADFETPTALLCAEASAQNCHRRLVCEYLAEHWRDVRCVHL